jgi:hypothetical protein
MYCRNDVKMLGDEEENVLAHLVFLQLTANQTTINIRELLPIISPLTHIRNLIRTSYISKN